MAQLTIEERRRIFLKQQEADGEVVRRLSAPVAAPEPLTVRGQLRRILEISLIAALLSAGWFVFQGVAFNVPASLADMLPRV